MKQNVRELRDLTGVSAQLSEPPDMLIEQREQKCVWERKKKKLRGCKDRRSSTTSHIYVL